MLIFSRFDVNFYLTVVKIKISLIDMVFISSLIEYACISCSCKKIAGEEGLRRVYLVILALLAKNQIGLAYFIIFGLLTCAFFLIAWF